MRVLSFAQFTRRDRFVLAAALSFGLADILVPDIFTHLFDGVQNPSSGLAGLFNSITIILSTPCTSASLCFSLPFLSAVTGLELTRIDIGVLAVLAAGIVASVLNVILPREMEDEVPDDEAREFEEQMHTGSSVEKVEV